MFLRAITRSRDTKFALFNTEKRGSSYETSDTSNKMKISKLHESSGTSDTRQNIDFTELTDSTEQPLMKEKKIRKCVQNLNRILNFLNQKVSCTVPPLTAQNRAFFQRCGTVTSRIRTTHFHGSLVFPVRKYWRIPYKVRDPIIIRGDYPTQKTILRDQGMKEII